MIILSKEHLEIVNARKSQRSEKEHSTPLLSNAALARAGSPISLCDEAPGLPSRVPRHASLLRRSVTHIDLIVILLTLLQLSYL